MNFDKSNVGLNYLRIFSMLTKFKDDQRSIFMLSINCLNSSFCNLKYYIKYEFMDQMVNYIWLACKLAYISISYKTCNSKVEFSKYEFNNKLLGGLRLLSVTLSNVTTHNNLL